ncbi:MAG: hypothetical protein ACI9IO_001558 [Cyanobium sp.]|jgi:hypothetical protein
MADRICQRRHHDWFETFVVSAYLIVAVHNGRCSPWPHRTHLSIEHKRYGQPTAYLLDKWFLISVPGR